ncbi:MAG: hypothetical protein ACJAXA_000350 [Candidatus Aldehydirespiratoraceae bacterium]|jgi:hypothetical protein
MGDHEAMLSSVLVEDDLPAAIAAFAQIPEKTRSVVDLIEFQKSIEYRPEPQR